ncbi:hypothetical protein [Acinetobacter nematophilus]
MISHFSTRFFKVMTCAFVFSSLSDSLLAHTIEYRTYRSQVLNCGEVTMQVVSQCLASTDGAESGSAGQIRDSCSSSQLLMNWKGQQKVLNFPISTPQQKKLLENQGYHLKATIQFGDWAPQSLACGQAQGITGYFVIVNQATTNDINQEYRGKGSLSEAPIVLNLNGSFTSDSIKQKIYMLSEQNKLKISKVVGANAIFADEE